MVQLERDMCCSALQEMMFVLFSRTWSTSFAIPDEVTYTMSYIFFNFFVTSTDYLKYVTITLDLADIMLSCETL